MPKGSSPSSQLKYLYKNLAGDKEVEEELFAGIPEDKRDGLKKLLGAINDAAEKGVKHTVKSMEEGTPSFPTSWQSGMAAVKDKVLDAIQRRDYDKLATALTSPDAEQIAKKLGFFAPVAKKQPVLRLTYEPEIAVGRVAPAKILTPEEKAANVAVRERMESLGIDMSVLRAQDINNIRSMEKKYGQSELGKFVVAHKNEPIMSKIWDVPQTEYNKATVNKMLRDSLYDKLDKASKARIDSEIQDAWNSHKVTIADMILAARKSAAELAAAKGEPVDTTSMGHAFLNITKP